MGTGVHPVHDWFPDGGLDLQRGKERQSESERPLDGQYRPCRNLYEQILRNAPDETEADRQDRGYLEEAIKVIRQQGKEADAGIAETKAKVSLREFERGLIRKQGDLHVSALSLTCSVEKQRMAD